MISQCPIILGQLWLQIVEAVSFTLDECIHSLMTNRGIQIKKFQVHCLILPYYLRSGALRAKIWRHFLTIAALYVGSQSLNSNYKDLNLILLGCVKNIRHCRRLPYGPKACSQFIADLCHPFSCFNPPSPSNSLRIQNFIALHLEYIPWSRTF